MCSFCCTLNRAMPAIRMFGRKWRVSSDFLPLFAGVGLLFHSIWVIFIIVWPFGITNVHKCNNFKAGRQFQAAVCLFFGLYVLSFFQELLITVIGLRGDCSAWYLVVHTMCMRTEHKCSSRHKDGCTKPYNVPLRCAAGDQEAQSYETSIVHPTCKLGWSTRRCE